jgi:hypothetical protein
VEAVLALHGMAGPSQASPARRVCRRTCRSSATFDHSSRVGPKNGGEVKTVLPTLA